MATPNLVNVATITPKNAMGNLGDTNRTTMVDVTAENAAKIQTILISNTDGTNACDVTIEVSNDNGSTYYKIASTISVPADSTLSFLDDVGPIWLDETDLLAVTAGTASDLSWHVSYVEIYGNEVTDLLRNGERVGHNKVSSQRYVMSGQAKQSVNSLNDIRRALEIGDAQKRRAATAMNDRSSS